MLGIADGINSGFGLASRAMREKAEREWAAKLQARQEQAWQREDQALSREDAAFRNLDTLRAQGVYEGDTGLSQPAMQMLAAGNAGAYGQGEAAIREATGDYAREAKRLSRSENAPAGGLPAYNPQADITKRGASDVETEQALGDIAVARRDTRGIRESAASQKQLKLEAGRRAELKRLNSLSDAELVATFEKQNRDGNFPGMVDFDPQTGRFMLVSRIEGIPSQSLSRAELIQQKMGLWEAGNGDYEKGLRAMVDTAKAERDLADKGYDRSARLAGLNADAHFKRKDDERGDRQLSAQEAHWKAQDARDRERLGMQRGQVERANWVPEQYIDAQGNVRVYDVNRANPGQPKFMERSMPAGLRLPRQQPDTRVNQDGSVLYGGKLYVPGKKPGEYIEAKGFGPSELDQRLAALMQNRGGAGVQGLRGAIDAGSTQGLRAYDERLRQEEFDRMRGLLAPRQAGGYEHGAR